MAHLKSIERKKEIKMKELVETGNFCLLVLDYIRKQFLQILIETVLRNNTFLRMRITTGSERKKMAFKLEIFTLTHNFRNGNES